jgi:hypothetical protein
VEGKIPLESLLRLEVAKIDVLATKPRFKNSHPSSGLLAQSNTLTILASLR